MTPFESPGGATFARISGKPNRNELRRRNKKWF